MGQFSVSSAQSLYIIDGDSINLKMRFADIDTPEIKQQCQRYKHKKLDCGSLSRRHLQKLLNNLPGDISIRPVGVDHYQRILVRVYKGDANIGQLMVQAGMAFAYKNVYAQEERLARAKKIGFWGFYKPPIKPYKWRKTHKRKY